MSDLHLTETKFMPACSHFVCDELRSLGFIEAEDCKDQLNETEV